MTTPLDDVLYYQRTYYNPKLTRYHFQDLQNDIPNQIPLNYKSICGENRNQIYEFDPLYHTPIEYRERPPVCYNMRGIPKEKCLEGRGVFDMSSLKMCPVPTVLKNPILYQYEKSGNPPNKLQVGPNPVYQDTENVWNNFTKRKLI